MRCPTCRATVRPQNEFRPFCSRRCKLVDLGKWLDGSYTLPGEPASEDDVAAEEEERVKDEGERRRH